MASSVELRGLERSFVGAERPAVGGIDLHVESGEVVSLVGPSGCGKSTTLRIVAGLERPDAGDVLIGGRSMLGVAPQARDVAMVFQGFALYPHMRVREILAFPLEMRKVPKPERARAVEEVAQMLGLTPLLDRRPTELSGGEQQRVAMGRAIVRRPQVFLFDEPLSNLDAALRHQLRVELGKLLSRLEATALYVTHDQAEAMTLSDRIAVMNAGRLEQVDTPRNIYERPATTFVASFFGTPPMNLVRGRRAGDRLQVGPLEVPAPPSSPDAVTVGFRPESLQIGPADTGGPTLEVGAVETFGAETHLELSLDGTSVRARAPGFSSHGPGDRVGVRILPEELRFFDSTTGRAIEA